MYFYERFTTKQQQAIENPPIAIKKKGTSEQKRDNEDPFFILPAHRKAVNPNPKYREDQDCQLPEITAQPNDASPRIETNSILLAIVPITSDKNFPISNDETNIKTNVRTSPASHFLLTTIQKLLHIDHLRYIVAKPTNRLIFVIIADIIAVKRQAEKPEVQVLFPNLVNSAVNVRF